MKLHPGVERTFDRDAVMWEVSLAYQRIVDDSIFVGMMTCQDVCVSSSLPFCIEMVYPDEEPKMKGKRRYVRYDVAPRNIH